MSMTVSVRIQRMTDSQAKGQSAHDERKEESIPDYVDISKSHLNSVIKAMKPVEQIREDCNRLRMSKGNKQRSMRSDAVAIWSGIVTFGSQAQLIINNLTMTEQNALYEKAIKRVAGFLNTEIESIAVHRDEAAPHAHFSLSGVNKNGVSLSKITNQEVYAKLQDAIAIEFEHLGIKRGEAKAAKIERLISEGKTKNEAHSAVIHKTVKRLHEALPSEIEALEEKIKLLEERAEKARQRELKAIEKAARAESNVETFEKRAAQAEARAAKAEAEIKDLQDELNRLKNAQDFPKPNRLKIKKSEIQRVGVFGKELEVVTGTALTSHEYYRADQVDAFFLKMSEQSQEKEKKLLEERELIKKAVYKETGKTLNRLINDEVERQFKTQTSAIEMFIEATRKKEAEQQTKEPTELKRTENKLSKSIENLQSIAKALGESEELDKAIENIKDDFSMER